MTVDGAERMEFALSDGEGCSEDGEGCSEASDSEYGLSDRQFEDIWQQFDAGNVEVEIALSDGEEEDLQDRADDAFGLGEAQFRSLGRTCNPGEDPLKVPSHRLSRSVLQAPEERLVRPLVRTLETPPVTPSGAPQDPLRHFLAQRKASGSEDWEKKLAKATPIKEEQPARRSVTRNDNESLYDAARALAKMHQVKQRAPTQKAVLVSSRERGGTMWYLFRIHDQGEERFYLKCYKDFVRLNGAIKDAYSRGVRRRPVPVLPEVSLLNLRQLLDVPGFNNERRIDLERYVEELVAGINSFREDPHLEAFFGVHAPGRTYRGTKALEPSQKSGYQAVGDPDVPHFVAAPLR